MDAILYFFELGIITFAGVALGCKVFAYEISRQRQLVAAGLFALLYTVPLAVPVVRHLLPALALYLVLRDADNDLGEARKVFVFTWAFAFVAVLILTLVTGAAEP